MKKTAMLGLAVVAVGCGGMTPGSSSATDYDFRSCQQQEELGASPMCWKLFLIHHRDNADEEQLRIAEAAANGSYSSAQVPVAAVSPEVVPDRLAEAKGRPGDAQWDQSVRAILVGAYDKDGSGAIDSPDELDSIDCESFYVLDDALTAEQGVPLYALYGFAPSFQYVGEELGFDERLRDDTYNALLSCGVGEEGGSSGGPVAGVFGTLGGRDLSDQFSSPAGSSDWDREVEEFMLSAHDRNGSSTIDTESELRGISCDEFAELDRALINQMGTPLFALYGFGPDYAWVGDALGFEEDLRQTAFLRLDDCGLVDE